MGQKLNTKNRENIVSWDDLEKPIQAPHALRKVISYYKSYSNSDEAIRHLPLYKAIIKKIKEELYPLALLAKHQEYGNDIELHYYPRRYEHYDAEFVKSGPSWPPIPIQIVH